eukprot:239159_1
MKNTDSNINEFIFYHLINCQSHYYIILAQSYIFPMVNIIFADGLMSLECTSLLLQHMNFKQVTIMEYHNIIVTISMDAYIADSYVCIQLTGKNGFHQRYDCGSTFLYVYGFL